MSEKITFEDKLKELSEIVNKLEDGEVILDEAVRLYKKGMELSLECRKELDKAKLKITENGGETNE